MSLLTYIPVDFASIAQYDQAKAIFNDLREGQPRYRRIAAAIAAGLPTDTAEELIPADAKAFAERLSNVDLASYIAIYS